MNQESNASMPFSDETEKAVLSCFFAHPSETLPDFMATMTLEAFYHPANRLFFTTLCEMHLAGKPIESPAVLTYMMDAGTLDRIGGPGTLAEVATTHMAPSLYSYYKGILRGKLLLRRMLTAAQEAAQAILSHDPASPVEETLAVIEQSILAVREESEQSGKFRTWKKLIQDTEDRYEAAIKSDGALPGVSTGYRRLDSATGGMREGQVWTVGGGTSDGKSAFVQNIITHLGRARIPTCLYTLEMTDEENADRMFSIQSCVPSAEFLHGLSKREDMRAFAEAKSELQQWPFHVRDVSGIKLSALRADMRRMSRKYGIRVFALDYLQLVSPDQKAHSREREVAEISAAMKAEAKLLRASILNLSQLNDQGALRESRAIGQDSDVIAILEVPENEDGEPIESSRILTLKKVRGGKRGTVLHFEFNGPTYRFTEVTGG